ncbi:MAG: CoA pyrophosphatase [Rhodospirillales bacterium]|nr:CoA pyrophosphatase [Rhodospirillales bacterium]
MTQRDSRSSQRQESRGLCRDVLVTCLGAARKSRRRGDGDLSDDHDLKATSLAATTLVRAAVLVPLVDRPDGLTVMLTQRTAHLAHHPGQISFPGGRLEPGDRDPESGALRETFEEIGLEARHVEILGRLDTYVTRTAFEVTPVVGLVTPPFTLTLDPFEVADVFEAPLAFILDPASRQVGTNRINGIDRRFHAIPYGERYIWGATAGMLVNLADLLADS